MMSVAARKNKRTATNTALMKCLIKTTSKKGIQMATSAGPSYGLELAGGFVLIVATRYVRGAVAILAGASVFTEPLAGLPCG
jgi:hypothetical protein